MNGNEFGNGAEPKGLEKDGKKWIFGYDRVSIPSSIQFIGDGKLTVHNRVRPVGSRNEALFHCRWRFKGEHGIGNRGTLNDWLVAWPCAFRLSVLAAK